MEQADEKDNHSALRGELLAMGFDKERVQSALRVTALKEEAVNLLLAEAEAPPSAGVRKVEGVGEGEGEEGSEGDFEDEQEDYKMIFVVRSDLKLGLAKLAELVATAALQAYRQIETQIDVDELKEIAFFEWSESGQKKIVVKAPTAAELTLLAQRAEEKKINFVLVKELLSNLVEKKTGGRKKVVEEEGKKEEAELVLGAFGPASESELDPLTKHFKLL